MAKRTKHESKGFDIICRECGFRGDVSEFYFYAADNSCELCGSHGFIKMLCNECKIEKGRGKGLPKNEIYIEEW